MADRIKNYQQEADQITTLKAIRTDLGVTPSSYTPDATVVTKDRVVTFAQAEEELVVLSDIEKGVKQQVTEVDIAQKDIANIKALLQGHLYDYQTDTTSAYTKTVPNGAMPYAGVEKVGGRTLVANNIQGLFGNIQQFTDRSITVTTNTNPDGSATYTFDGTSTGSNTYTIQNYTFLGGHKYIIKGCPSNGSADTYYYGYGNAVHDVGEGYYYAPSNNFTSFLSFHIKVGSVFNNAKVCLQCIDLTLMFGAGNEPASVAEYNAIIKADFPMGMPSKLLSAGVTEVKPDSKNLLDQALFLNAISYHTEYDGYWKMSTYLATVKYPDNNYAGNASPVFTQPTLTLSFEAKRPNTGDYGINFAISLLKSDGTKEKIIAAITDTWQKFSVTLTGNTDGAKIGFYYYQSVDILIRNMQVEANSVATEYSPYGNIATYPIPTAIRNLEGYGWSAGSMYNYVDFERKVFVKNVGSRAYASGDESDSTFITDGTTTYYPLTTAVETDISAYITDDKLINVEAGGTLTFPNGNGTDYQIPVPSEETYMIDLQEAINNG